jgi:NAD(P)-dependent dehydrogenase (short-subunit alcohol dehydrogenase family)
MGAPPVSSLLDLKGKTALVTGANAGIGRGIAERLAEAGAAVGIHYRSGKDEAEALAAKIRSAGGKAVAVQAELTDEASAKAAFDAVNDAIGPIDILVNNAARQTHAMLREMDLAEWTAMMNANLNAVFILTKLATARMIERKSEGAIINIASISGINATLTHAHYATSKAALIMFTEAAAIEYGRYGIRVNAVSPGVIYRDGIEANWPDGVKRWMNAVPLGRMGENEDVGDAVLFLASAASRFITGINLIVDGGITAMPTF